MRRLEEYLGDRWARKLLLAVVMTMPVVAYGFMFSIVYRNGALPSDWMYFTQLYEAARQSIVHYHQFPWWNPWALGGLPLYANPQFGLFSIQMALVLIFGTVKGLHFAVMVYLILGFWGMVLLLRRIGARGWLLPALLSYIWVFGSFMALHISVGHLTFTTYLLAPWVFLALLNIYRPKGWLWFGLVVAYIVNQAPHYMTIHILMISSMIALVLLYRTARTFGFWCAVKPFILSGVIILPLIAHKMYFTMQYMHEYPRLVAQEIPNTTNLIIASLTFRHPVDPVHAFNMPYGWHEYGAYIGLITLALASYMIIRAFTGRKRPETNFILVLGAVLVALSLSIGGVTQAAPYALMHHLPFLNQMQVASRWLGWVVFGVILLLKWLPRHRIVYALLAVSAIDVFLVGYPILNAHQDIYQPPAQRATSFEEHTFYQDAQHPQRLLYATQANAGELYGYEPIIGVFAYPSIADYSNVGYTTKCGMEMGCSFVMSHNATVTYWSPTHIKLTRTDQGAVVLNMNPGKDWCVNGKALSHSGQRLFEPKDQFAIADSSPNLDISFSPFGCD